jgi:hypothetical protein
MTEPNEDIVVSRIDTMPDWKCSFCGSVNPSNAISCSHCKKTREESDAHYFELLSNDDLSSIPPPPEALQSLFSFPKFSWTSWERFRRPSLKLLVPFAALCVGILAWFLLSPSSTPSTNYKVVEVKWERTISVERYLPSNKKSPEKRLYMPFRTVKSEGKDNLPKWPLTNLGRTADGKPDKEGRKVESYSVRLERLEPSQSFPRIITLTTSESEFRELFLLGKTIAIQKDDKGGVSKISPESSITKTQK